MEIEKFFATYKLPIILGGISILAIAFSIIVLIKSEQSAAPIKFSSGTDEASASAAPAAIAVDIEGAVVHPGLYRLPEGDRVEDAITAAGGLSPDVDAAAFGKTVNRAMKLVDGGKIVIPIVGSSPEESNQSSLLISVNSGAESDLDSLPGVGPVTAGKIISGRPYQTLEELVSKKAVGQALFEKIKDQISL